MKTILLKLSGPLQAWGTESHFETRQTDRYPSKSAIVGLIAGAMGYRREENDKMVELNNMGFAVRIDQKGVLLRDYHTAKMYTEKGDLKRTYVTNRYYLQDAMFIVAISSDKEELIQKIYHSLKYPYFQPFLGKRSLPLNPDFILGITDLGVIESLKKLPWQATQWYQKKYKKINNVYFAEIYADSNLLSGKTIHYRRDNVISFSQKNRSYSLRAESVEVLHFTIDENGTFGENIEKHDIFGRLEE